MPALPDAASLARPLVADGGMGTMLFAAGMPAGLPPEAWLLEAPGAAAVSSVHAAYAAAGSNLVLTCTFGGNPIRLTGSEADGRSVEVSRAAVALARAAVGPDRLVAGSMGPTGGLMIPYGLLDPSEVADAFAVQAAALAEGGVDVLWVETMMDLKEAVAAVEGARRGAPQLPVVATMTFQGNGRTMFGDRVEAVADALLALGIAGIGANCGDGFAPVEAVIPTLARMAGGLHVVAKANAGIPVGDADGNTVYPATPADAADHARRVRDAGATIIGGCCGTTPAHLAAVASALAG